MCTLRVYQSCVQSDQAIHDATCRVDSRALKYDRVFDFRVMNFYVIADCGVGTDVGIIDLTVLTDHDRPTDQAIRTDT